MFRSAKVDIPPNTTEAAPVTEIIALRHGVITEWFVGFPDGCADLVHVAVYEHEHRILPRDEDQDLFWNDYVFRIREHWLLEDEPYRIEVRAWNEDDSYTHSVFVGVTVIPVAAVTVEGLLQRLLTALVGG